MLLHALVEFLGFCAFLHHYLTEQQTVISKKTSGRCLGHLYGNSMDACFYPSLYSLRELSIIGIKNGGGVSLSEPLVPVIILI